MDKTRNASFTWRSGGAALRVSERVGLDCCWWCCHPDHTAPKPCSTQWCPLPLPFAVPSPRPLVILCPSVSHCLFLTFLLRACCSPSLLVSFSRFLGSSFTCHFLSVPRFSFSSFNFPVPSSRFLLLYSSTASLTSASSPFYFSSFFPS